MHKDTGTHTHAHTRAQHVYDVVTTEEYGADLEVRDKLRHGQAQVRMNQL